MPNNITMKLSLFAVVILFAAGCVSKQPITTRAYVDDKPRVDQKMEGGNFGYLSGTPKAPDRTELKDTRKIFVVEFTKEIEDADDVELNLPPRRKLEPRHTPPPPPAPRPEPQRVSVPSFADEPAPSGTTEYIDYEIQKNDTLQKISKKFYDSYAKWPKIHAANQDVIKDPNRIKPGTMIRIPVE